MKTIDDIKSKIADIINKSNALVQVKLPKKRETDVLEFIDLEEKDIWSDGSRLPVMPTVFTLNEHSKMGISGKTISSNIIKILNSTEQVTNYHQSRISNSEQLFWNRSSDWKDLSSNPKFIEVFSSHLSEMIGFQSGQEQKNFTFSLERDGSLLLCCNEQLYLINVSKDNVFISGNNFSYNMFGLEYLSLRDDKISNKAIYPDKKMLPPERLVLQEKDALLKGESIETESNYTLKLLPNNENDDRPASIEEVFSKNTVVFNKKDNTLNSTNTTIGKVYSNDESEAPSQVENTEIISTANQCSIDSHGEIIIEKPIGFVGDTYETLNRNYQKALEKLENPQIENPIIDETLGQ